MTLHSSIAGTGSCLPKKTLSNLDLEKLVDTSDEWIVSRTGIKNRHIISSNESVVTMAKEAANKALEHANTEAQMVDLIIFATSTPERPFPSSACLLQKQLGIKHCIAFDMSAACSGFVYALQVADLYLKNDMAKNALIIGSEALSTLVDWQDRSTCVLFGDGAGALLLTQSGKPGILSTHLYSESQYSELLYVTQKHPQTIKMQGNAVFKVAVNKLAHTITHTLAHHDLSPSDLDWLVPHQANLRIIRSIADKLNIPIEQVVITLDQHGNTSAASIPLALDHAIKHAHIKKNQLILLESFGAGFTWGSALIRY